MTKEEVKRLVLEKYPDKSLKLFWVRSSQNSDLLISKKGDERKEFSGVEINDTTLILHSYEKDENNRARTLNRKKEHYSIDDKTTEDMMGIISNFYKTGFIPPILPKRVPPTQMMFINILFSGDSSELEEIIEKIKSLNLPGRVLCKYKSYDEFGKEQQPKLIKIK